MINERAMLCFLKTAELRSYTLAAREMQISQQAVSKQVLKLEQELGIRLLERSTHHVKMTEIGCEFYDLFSDYIRRRQSILRSAQKGEISRE